MGLGAGDIRSILSNTRGALDSEHLWPSTGGYSGVHRKGSARVFVGTTSQISSSDTNGRLMFCSTDSNLYYVGSEGTANLSGLPANGVANRLGRWMSSSVLSSSGASDNGTYTSNWSNPAVAVYLTSAVLTPSQTTQIRGWTTALATGFAVSTASLVVPSGASGQFVATVRVDASKACIAALKVTGGGLFGGSFAGGGQLQNAYHQSVSAGQIAHFTLLGQLPDGGAPYLEITEASGSTNTIGCAVSINKLW